VGTPIAVNQQPGNDDLAFQSCSNEEKNEYSKHKQNQPHRYTAPNTVVDPICSGLRYRTGKQFNFTEHRESFPVNGACNH
jgi:hypothetical protein